MRVCEAHRKHVCMRHRAGLLEVVLQGLPGGLLGQVVRKDALATAAAAPAAAASASAFRSAPLSSAALGCLEIKVLPVLPACTQNFAA